VPRPLRLPPPENLLVYPLRDIGTHGQKPIEGIKDLLLFAVLGFIDHLGILGKIGHPLLGERGLNDVTG